MYIESQKNPWYQYIVITLTGEMWSVETKEDLYES